MQRTYMFALFLVWKHIEIVDVDTVFIRFLNFKILLIFYIFYIRFLNAKAHVRLIYVNLIFVQVYIQILLIQIQLDCIKHSLYF